MTSVSIRKLFLLPVRAYKALISPFLPAACNFIPTCSDYFSCAVIKHGLFKGGLLGLRRVCRCHPFARGGFDPVP